MAKYRRSMTVGERYLLASTFRTHEETLQVVGLIYQRLAFALGTFDRPERTFLLSVRNACQQYVAAISRRLEHDKEAS